MLTLSLSAWLCALLLQLCIKNSLHIFLITSGSQYIILYNCTMLHMSLHFQLNQGMGSVTQCCHLMVRNYGIGGLKLKKGFSLLFLASLNGTSNFVRIYYLLLLCFSKMEYEKIFFPLVLR